VRGVLASGTIVRRGRGETVHIGEHAWLQVQRRTLLQEVTGVERKMPAVGDGEDGEGCSFPEAVAAIVVLYPVQIREVVVSTIARNW
jgi:hypothetical protein